MRKLLEAFRNIFSTPDLRKRVLFALALLAVYRLGSFIPTPGINTDLLEQLFKQYQGSALGIFNLFSGGNLRRLTIFALGIMPYITSSIILQLLVVVWPYLERLQKEGELGRRKITQYTRYLTIILSAFQSFAIARTLEAQNMSGAIARLSSGPAIHLDDHADADHRLGVHHVARRADQRPRHRQWNVAHHFHWNRGRASAGRVGSLGQDQDGIVGLVHSHRHHRLACADARGGGVYRVRRGRPAAHSGAVRQARDGAQGDGRADDLSAAAREFRRRDSADFRELAA